MSELILLFIQVELVAIAFIALAIAVEFYKYKDGILRIIIIELFSSKVLLYGGMAVYFAWLHGWVNVLVYLQVLLIPMLSVMIQLYLYIRNKNNS
jgi:hypothetical protein